MTRRRSNAAHAATATFVVCLIALGSSMISHTAATASTTATATLTAGALGLTAPMSVAFSATLNGHDQLVSSSQALDVLDGTGSGLGWNITATSTTFVNAESDTLSTAAVTELSGPSQACDASSSCVLATTNVSYPYTLPAASVAPTATKVFNAVAATGLGDQTSTHTLELAVPSAAKAGVYSSTWTYSVISGP